MISVEDALAQVLALVTPTGTENIPLDQACGRIMAHPATARLNQPPFNASAMDGYAIQAADAQTDRPLRIIGEAAAGHPWHGRATPGTAIRIFTGAPVPDGYDRVIMQEDCRREGDHIVIKQLSDNMNIRQKGNDFKKDQPFFPRRALSPRDIGLLAAMNIAEISVHRKPKVSIIAGGDELIPVGQDPLEGQIISSNDHAISAFIQSIGGLAKRHPLTRDSEESIRQTLFDARDSDLIITIGGASVGDHDLIGKVASDLGLDRSFYKIAMRPGKPLLAGRMGRSAFIGLPGNPVSAMVCAEIFIKPMIYLYQGIDYRSDLKKATLTHPLSAEGPRTHYLRATVAGDQITAASDQDSARLGILAESNALLRRPAYDPPRKAGDEVYFIPLTIC